MVDGTFVSLIPFSGAGKILHGRVDTSSSMIRAEESRIGELWRESSIL
jgi:hypothetical protein